AHDRIARSEGKGPRKPRDRGMSDHDHNLNERSGSDRQRKAAGQKQVRRKATVRSRGRSLKRRSRRKSVQHKTSYPSARAQKSLQRFRQASILAVVLTGFLLMFFGNEGSAQQEVPDTVAVIEEFALEDLQ